MRNLLIRVVFVVALVGCSAADTGLPLPEGTVVDLLTELHLADSRMLLDETSPDSLRNIILSRYGLDEASFDDLSRYLSNNPDEMAAIYGKVVDKIVATEDRISDLED